MNVRLDPETRRAIENFQKSSSLETFSAAIRVLITLGLEKAAPLEETLKKSLHTEATISAQRKMRAKIERATQEALAEFEDG